MSEWFGRMSEAVVSVRERHWGSGLQRECQDIGRKVTVTLVVGARRVALTLDSLGRYEDYVDLGPVA